MRRTVCIVLLLIGIIARVDAQKDDGEHIFYFDNGEVASRGKIENGNPVGMWVSFYRGGKLKSRGIWENKQLEGKWEFFDSEGDLKSIIHYKAGEKHGEVIHYSKGEVIQLEHYENGGLHGKQIIYDTQSGQQEEKWFVDGLAEGVGYVTAADGRITLLKTWKKGRLMRRESINQFDGDGEKDGKWKIFYDNRQLKEEGRYLHGEKHGYFKYYNERGKLLSFEKYQQGERIDNPEELSAVQLKEVYSESGKIERVTPYKDGLKQGIERLYDLKGEVNSYRLYDQDILLGEGTYDEQSLRQGSWELYYESGQIRSTGSFKNGVRVGKWVFYFEDGKKEQEGFYQKSGKETGLWKWFYPNGNLKREESYASGKENGFMVEFNEKGDTILVGEFIDGEKEGRWKRVTDGHIQVGRYQADRKMGIWRHYYPGGQLAFEGDYFDGDPVGKHTFFYPNGQKKQEGKYESGEKVGSWRSYESTGERALSILYEYGIEKKLEGVKIKPEHQE